MENEDALDALIVGAGFSGLHTLHKLRKEGFRVKLYEAGDYLGGSWYWNCYPGARADSDSQVYQFSHDDLWKGFEWNERFPSYFEMKNYFQYVDEQLNLSKDIQYKTRVTAATYNSTRNQWLVDFDNGKSIWTNYFILCTGFASKRFIPSLPGLDGFQGECHHTGAWPQAGLDLKGKRVAVIGTGASGVQVIEKIGPEVSQLTVYQRTPNMALPMVQYSAPDRHKWQPEGLSTPDVFYCIRKTFVGLAMDFNRTNTFDDSPEERLAFYEELFQQGGLAYWLANYRDLLFDTDANNAAYQFWCEKTRARITDPAKKDILAPLDPPHAFGTTQPCLEQAYYEVMNQNNVKVINVRQSPIIGVTKNSIQTEKEGCTEVDIIIFATGYDSVTGGILNINIKNGNGETLRDKWLNGPETYLGMTTVGFPNFFFLYGPQSPNGLSIGPTLAEVQGGWLTDLLVLMRNLKQTTVEPTEEAEESWGKLVNDKWHSTLFSKTDSWYQGSNIPGKPTSTQLSRRVIGLYIHTERSCQYRIRRVNICLTASSWK